MTNLGRRSGDVYDHSLSHKERMKILIVDDNANDRKLLHMILERHGCDNVVEACDGQEGLDMAREQRPDLIVSDALMPRLDGFEFLRALKTDDELKSIPFVFYSAVYTGSRDEELATRLGAAAFITNPKEPEEFWKEITVTLERVAGGKELLSPSEPAEEEKEYLRQHSGVVAAKLEEKVRELEESLARSKEAEEALRESEERFRRLADTAPVMIWEAGADAGITFFNKPWLEYTGRNMEQELGNGWTQGVHPDDLERSLDTYMSAVKDHRSLSMEFRLRRVDGEYGWIAVTGAPRLSPAGDLLGYVGSCFDITDRKQVKDNLEKANELLMQRVAERTSELSDTIANLQDEIEERIRMAQALQMETTERLNAQAELRKKDMLLLQQSRLAAMGEMIGNIAHQWRQPLNMLGLLVQEMPMIYKRGEFSAEYLGANVERMLETINHMSMTIDDFRNYCRPCNENEDFKILEIVGKTISLLESSSHQIRTAVVAACDPVVNGCANEFSQVLLNIMINARDAFVTKNVADPTITIEVGNENGKCVVTITDNAGGIPEEIIDKIFDPYFTTKGPEQGTGVGLFMAKTIVEKHMFGSLSACNVNGGAQFRIVV